MWIYAASVLLASAGCNAKRRVAESAAVSADTAERMKRVVELYASRSAASEANMVLEQPEIVIHDEVSGQSVTIKGERLSGKSATQSENSAAAGSDTERTGEATVRVADTRRTATEGSTGLNLKFLLISAAVLWVAARWKKSGK